MTAAVAVPLALVASKGYYQKKAIQDLPKAITLSPEELGAHMRSQGFKSETKELKAKKLAGGLSGYTETEITYSGEQKGSVFVLDSPERRRCCRVGLLRPLA